MVSAVRPDRQPHHRDAYQLAVDARDPRFDGVFFVGITTTHVYCRPCCTSRLAYDRHRRFFNSAAAAERAGYRPCLRCRPELAPGRGGAPLDAVSRLAHVAAQRIAAGALNGHNVADLAEELGVSARHLRRALEREISVSPLELAQTHRLLLAKRLIVDTDLPMTRVAYASGFQSLRRFNAVFRQQYRMPPSALRRGRRAPAGETGSLTLSLSYRPPLLWDALLADLRGIEGGGGRYQRSVQLGGHAGIVYVENQPDESQLVATVSESLLPVLMPLIAGLRRVFDLDAEPAVVAAHLSTGGLGPLVAQYPGVRVPGAFDSAGSPDQFCATDRRLHRAAGVRGARALLTRAEGWRPWRAYAAQLLLINAREVSRRAGYATSNAPAPRSPAT
jgi:AraC family transcriptional regulator of adaptative response / DNA-3-methyladenine glycosylase II